MSAYGKVSLLSDASSRAFGFRLLLFRLHITLPFHYWVRNVVLASRKIKIELENEIFANESAKRKRERKEWHVLRWALRLHQQFSFAMASKHNFAFSISPEKCSPCIVWDVWWAIDKWKFPSCAFPAIREASVRVASCVLMWKPIMMLMNG